MNLAHLPGCAKESWWCRSLNSFVAIWNDQLNTFQTAIFKLIKESCPESFALIVRYLGTQDLAISIVTNSRNDEKGLGNIFSPIPDFKIACIDKEIGNRALDRFLEELRDLFIELLGYPGDCRSWQAFNSQMGDNFSNSPSWDSLKIRFRYRIC